MDGILFPSSPQSEASPFAVTIDPGTSIGDILKMTSPTTIGKATIVDVYLTAPSGATAATSANSAGITYNIPVTGVDATLHKFEWDIDSNAVLKVVGTGNGAGAAIDLGVMMPQHVAAGNGATIGGSTSFEGVFTFEQTITDFSVSTLWSVFQNYVTVNPSANIATTEVYASDIEANVPITNNKNILRVQAEYSQSHQAGSGNLSFLVGKELYVWTDGNGTIGNLWCASYASWINTGSTSHVTDNYCMQLKSGNFGAAGAIIDDDVTLLIKSPYSAAGTTMTSHIGLEIQDQGFGTTPRGIVFVASGVGNSIVWGSSTLQYSSGANDMRFMDATNARGVSFTLTAAGNQTIAATGGTLILTAPNIGVATATSINGLTITSSSGTLTVANGATLATSGAFVTTITSTGATSVTLPTSGILVSSVTTGNGVSAVNTAGALAFTLGAITPTTVNGNTITTGTGTLTLGASKVATISNTLTFTGTDGSSVAFGTGGTAAYTANKLSVFAATSSAELAGVISDETGGAGVLVFNANPTLAGASISSTNTISFNGSALLNGSAANNIRMTDSTAVGGLDYNLTTTNVTLNTVTQNLASIILQNQTFTAGANHSAVQLTPTWVSENFIHTALTINATQNGANTTGVQGIQITMTKATAATTNATMNGILINAPVVAGTVTNSNAINIGNQATAGIGSPRGIRFTSTGISNSIVWGNSALQFANTTENIRFMDSTNARGIDMTFTAAGVQTLNDTAGGLVLGRSGGSIAFMGGTASAVQTSGENLTNNVTSGGTDGTIANYTDLTLYANDAAAIRNDIYQLARKLKQVNDALRLYGLLT